MRYAFLDTETRSRTPIEWGNDLYTRNAQCLIVTYALSQQDAGGWHDRPVKIWEPWQDPMIPADLAEAIADDEVIFVAHSAVFDRLILLRTLKIRIALRRWMCTREMAYAHGLPGSLELLGIVVGLPEDKQKLVEDGKLIHTFCVPQAALGRFIEPWEKPDEWQTFCRYAIRDTDSLREIFKRLPHHNYSGFNLEVAHINALTNERGFEFDSVLATAAVSFLADAKVSSDRAIESLSENQVHAATQRNRLLRYLRERKGIDIESLRAAEVREWLEHDDLEPSVRLLLEQRLEASKSSGSKYTRGLRMVGPRNRMRNTIQFNGAGRTGRDSGRGFQPQNMARPVLTVRRESGRIELTPVKAKYIDEVILPGIINKQALNNDLVYGGPNEAAALALRHVIKAACGNHLVTADWKNVESVITAWVAGEDDELQAFKEAFEDTLNKAKDVYRLQWANMFGGDPLKVTDTERQGGKVVKLAFSFGGGVGALVTMAAGYQMDLEPLAEIVLPRATDEQKAKAYKAWRRAFQMGEDFGLDPKVYQACDILKQVYRTTNKKIDQLKRDVDTAVKGAIESPNSAIYNVARCKIWSNGQYLIIELPSSRRLLYASPQLHREVKLDPEGGKPWVTEYTSYLTARGKQWRRERAWSGLYVENIVQAIANDLLRCAKVLVHEDTLSVPAIAAFLDTLPEEERTAIALAVHDELVCDVPIGSYPMERLVYVMTKLIAERYPWVRGLPLAADAWINPRYGKR